MNSNFDLLPDLFNVFLDKNPNYKQFVVECGDWGFLNNISGEGVRLDNVVYMLRPAYGPPIWFELQSSWRKFLKEWDSI